MNVIDARPQSSLRKDDDYDDFDKELETYIGQHEEKPNKQENSKVSICDRRMCMLSYVNLLSKLKKKAG